MVQANKTKGTIKIDAQVSTSLNHQTMSISAAAFLKKIWQKINEMTTSKFLQKSGPNDFTSCPISHTHRLTVVTSSKNITKIK